MSYILNIESSTGVCSVALSESGRLTALVESAEGNDHARLLGVYVQEVMKRSGVGFTDLSAVAISKGPGSYTGLRIGVSMAKGICYANNIPLIAVSSLQAMSSYVSANLAELASQSTLTAPSEITGPASIAGPANPIAFGSGRAGDVLFCPMIDARRMEVYTAIFDGDNTEIEGVTAKILDDNSFKALLDKQPVVFFGNGSVKLEQVLQHANAFFITDIRTSAKFMCLLSHKYLQENKFEDLAYFEPFYLKDFIAGISKKKVL